MLERIQKILSARGIASRRKAEEYITQGLVKVNGVVATLGQKADPDVDTIEVDGKVLQARQEMLYYLMHKPVGVETTNIDGDQRDQGHQGDQRVQRVQGKDLVPTVRDVLPPELRGKVFPVGRLDKDSSGLIIFTNDGVLAYRLTHPKFDHEKEYAVEVEGEIYEGALDKLRRGVKIDEEMTKPAKITKTGINSFRIAITEGRNRQIRRMCQKIGSPVVTLRRIRIVTLVDDKLQPGQLRQLSDKERIALLQAIGVA